ncbi:MAG: TonB-dependent receptor [Muribaculaceae bacterium]|nr:TonB-dependent receptor [Muribaculaceae bacterium]
MKQRILFFLVCIGLLAGSAYARTIKGTVIDASTNEPIVGASVFVKGTQVGASTDIDGNYSINVPDKAKTLSVTYIGMVPQEVAIADNQVIKLEAQASSLDEVVVVAYGTQKKSSVTGSISQVSSAEIEMRPVSSVASALEGSTSGISVSGAYGAPGESPTIRIRGIGSVNNGTTPLYVIDGVPFGGNISDLSPDDIESMSVLKDASSVALYGSRAGNGVILITTKKAKKDRISFTFKTNQGVYQRGIPEYERVSDRQFMNVEYTNMVNNYLATKGLDRSAENIAEARLFANEHLIADRLYTNIYNLKDNELFENGMLRSDAAIKGTYGEDIDWYDQAIKNGYRAEYVFSGSGATDRSDYYFSVNYLNEDGYLESSGFNRLSGRAAVNVKPVKWLKTGLNINATHQKLQNSKGVGDDNTSYINPFYFCRYMAPIYPVHLHNPETGEYLLDTNGKLIYDIGNNTVDGEPLTTRNQNADRHIIYETSLNSNNTIRNTMNAIAYADIILPYGITASLKGNLSTRNSEKTEMKSKLIGDSKGTGSIAKYIYNYKNWTFQQQLRWVYTFDRKHNVNLLLGHENYSYHYDYTYLRKENEKFAGIPAISNYTTVSSNSGYRNYLRTESYLGRIQYNYDDRYNIEGSIRRDGSSRFARGHRWGTFGSVGANWVFSNEAFMKNITWLNSGKLRGGWGQVGNDDLDSYYGYMALYGSSSSGTNAGNAAYWIDQNFNGDLSWETSESWGIGLESRMFNRWNFEIEYYARTTKDLLFEVYAPNSAGSTDFKQAQSIMNQNMGSIRNCGIEINTDVDVYTSKDWTVNIAANLTTLKNKVTKLPANNQKIISGSHCIMEGHSRYDWYTYHYAGVDQLTGKALYDADHSDHFYYLEGEKIFDGSNPEAEAIPDENLFIINGKAYTDKTNYAQRDFRGCALPTVYGSFTGNFRWKNLNLSAMFTYSLGGKIFDSTYASLMSVSSSAANYHVDILNSWDGVPEGITEDSANRLTYAYNPIIEQSTSSDNNASSDRWLISRNYICLKNLNLSYSLPKAWVSKLDLKGVQVSFAGENLFTKAKRKGLDPSMSIGGGQYNYVAAARVFTFGLTVNL